MENMFNVTRVRVQCISSNRYGWRFHLSSPMEFTLYRNNLFKILWYSGGVDRALVFRLDSDFLHVLDFEYEDNALKTIRILRRETSFVHMVVDRHQEVFWHHSGSSRIVTFVSQAYWIPFVIVFSNLSLIFQFNSPKVDEVFLSKIFFIKKKKFFSWRVLFRYSDCTVAKLLNIF